MDESLEKFKAITSFAFYRIHYGKILPNCDHLHSINPDQVLKLDSTFKNQEYKKATLFHYMANCNNLKSFCMNSSQFSFISPAFVLEVIKRCPELECIKLGDPVIEIDDWEQVLDQIGPRMVHFAGFRYDTGSTATEEVRLSVTKKDAELIEMVALKCPNIKQVDWSTDGRLNRYLVVAFKMLPRNCWVTLKCKALAKYAFQDDVDEMDIRALDWSKINKLERLSKLSFYGSEITSNGIPVRGVDFAGLEKLKLFEDHYPIVSSVDRLVKSQFPVLKDFHFDASVDFTEDNYETLFQRMPSLMRMSIEYGCNSLVRNRKPNIPGSAIRHLNNLETIHLIMIEIPSHWESEDFLQKIELYSDVVKSLKKLILDLRRSGSLEDFAAKLKGTTVEKPWKKTIEEKIEELKLKQNCFEIVLLPQIN